MLLVNRHTLTELIENLSICDSALHFVVPKIVKSIFSSAGKTDNDLNIKVLFAIGLLGFFSMLV